MRGNEAKVFVGWWWPYGQKMTKRFEKLTVWGSSRELLKMRGHEGSKEWNRHELDRRGVVGKHLPTRYTCAR